MFYVVLKAPDRVFQRQACCEEVSVLGCGHPLPSLASFFKVCLHGEGKDCLFHWQMVILWIPTLQTTVEVKACCPLVQQKCCLWQPRSGYDF